MYAERRLRAEPIVTVQSDIDVSSLPAVAQRALSAEAAGPMRQMAARGVIPGLKPDEIVQVLAVLAESPEPELASTALGTLAKLPAPILTGALGADLPAAAIAPLARAHVNQSDVVASLLRMPRINAETVTYLADVADERCGELIATNEQLMLRYPVVIERLYMNRRVRMSTADRLIELAVRNDIELSIPAFKEAAQAIRDQLIPEPTDERTYDDDLFLDAERVASEVGELDQEEDTHDVDEEGEEQIKEKFLPLHVLLAQSSVTQKIRRATLGNAAERLILVRDPNRLVAQAAVKSPLMREHEAVRISGSRSVSDDVLRIIAQNREFSRSYQVKLNIVGNPRTPFTFSSRFLPHLRENDVRAMSRSKNVTGAIAQAARQQLQRKQGKR